MGFFSKLLGKISIERQSSSRIQNQNLHLDSSDSEDEVVVSPSARKDPPDRSYTWANMGETKPSRPLRPNRESAGSSAQKMLEARFSHTPSSPSPPLSIDAEESPLRQFRFMKSIHSGRSCMIMEAVSRKTLKPVIIKAFKKFRISGTARDRIEREREAMGAAESVPNVMRFICSEEDDEFFYTVVEGSLGSTLIEVMASNKGRISQETCVTKVAVPLLKALQGLHDLGIVHRHLKPEHIMCDKISLMLIDFTDSLDMKRHCLNNRVGGLQYMAPEMLNKPLEEEIFHEVLEKGLADDELPKYDEKVDIWSLGVIIFEALTGQQPFLAESVTEMVQMQSTMLKAKDEGGVPYFISRSAVSAQSALFLSSIFQEEPSKRPSAKDLLQHPWLRDHVTEANVVPRPGSRYSCPDPFEKPTRGKSLPAVQNVDSGHCFDASND